MRKVAVNARITAYLCFLELVSMVCIGVVWLFVIGTSSAWGTTNSMIWYYIILPYTHLMNTSFNKDRIIDDGWKSVILNSLKSVFKCFYKFWSSGEERNSDAEAQAEEQSMKTRRARSIKKDNLNQSVSIKPEPDISIISLEGRMKDNDLGPSTSDGKQADPDGYRNIIESQASIDSDEDSNKLTNNKCSRLKKGENILSSMWYNLNDEEVYIHYFKQLVDLEYPSEENMVEHYDNFQLTPYSKMPNRDKACGTKRSHANQNTKKPSRKLIKHSDPSRAEEVILNVNFLVDWNERKVERKTLLEDFSKNCEDEISYQRIVNKLISFEENLIEG